VWPHDGQVVGIAMTDDLEGATSDPTK